MKRFVSLFLTVALLLSLFVGCSKATPSKGLSIEAFAERLNLVCDALGYEPYKITSKDIVVKRHSFSSTMLSGMFEVSGTLTDNVIESFSIRFSDELKSYLSDSQDLENVLLSTFFIESLLVLAFTDIYETVDKEDATDFMTETLFPSFETVQKIGDYKLNSFFDTSAKASAVVSLTLLS